jgi:methyl-accepting chemotaxis protein
MSPFGFVTKEKYDKLQNEKNELCKSLDEALDNLKKSKLRIKEISTSIETLSTKNIELTNSFHNISRERDQLQAKLTQYIEERQLLQKMIQDLDSLSMKRKKKTEESSLNIDSFESDIRRLLNRPSTERTNGS